MVEGGRRLPIPESGVSEGRLTGLLTNVPNIPNFQLLRPGLIPNEEDTPPRKKSDGSRTGQHTGRQTHVDPDGGPDGDLYGDPYGDPSGDPYGDPHGENGRRNGMRFHFGIFYAEASESEIRNFMEFLEILLRECGIRPKIWAMFYDNDSIGETYLESVKYGLDNCNYYFLYIDKNFVSEKWASFQTASVLKECFNDPTKKTIPIQTAEKLMCFGPHVIKPAQVWRLVDGLDIDFGTFIEDFENNVRACAGQQLRHLREFKEQMKRICLNARKGCSQVKYLNGLSTDGNGLSSDGNEEKNCCTQREANDDVTFPEALQNNQHQNEKYANFECKPDSGNVFEDGEANSLERNIQREQETAQETAQQYAQQYSQHYAQQYALHAVNDAIKTPRCAAVSHIHSNKLSQAIPYLGWATAAALLAYIYYKK